MSAIKRYTGSEWRQVKDWPDYEINSTGRLRRYVTPSTGSGGYQLVTLIRADKYQRTASIHRMVAEAFLPKVDGKPMVAHKDGDPANNKAENLYWADCQDNAADADRHGTLPKGEANGFAKLNENQVAVIRASKLSNTVLGRKFGVVGSTISAVRNRRTWQYLP